MQQFYTLRFLSSPGDPRYDGWIGQAYGLSYLNSEPGNNFLFSYKPYEIMHSRVNREERMAERLTDREVRLPLYAAAKKRSWSASMDRPATFVVKPILETLLSRNFSGVLDDVTAFVTGMVLVSVPTRDKGSGTVNTITTSELEERINTYVFSHYAGHRQEWLKETLFHHLMNSSHERWENEAIEKWIDFADLRFFPREAIDVGIYLSTFINKLRDGHRPYDFIQYSDLTDDFRQKATRTMQPLVGMELSYVPFINTGSYAQVAARPEEFASIDSGQWYGDTPEHGIYRYDLLNRGVRLDHSGITPTGVALGEERDRIGITPKATVLTERTDYVGLFQHGLTLVEDLPPQGHRAYGLEIADRPEKRALDLGANYLYMETLGKNQFVYPPMLLMDMARSNQTIIMDGLHLYETYSDQAFTMTDRISGEIDRNLNAMLYPTENPLGERHGSNAFIMDDITKLDYSRTDQAYINNGYVFIDGSPYKNSYITERVSYFEYTSDGDGSIIDGLISSERHGSGVYVMDSNPMFDHLTRQGWIEIEREMAESSQTGSEKNSWIYERVPMMEVLNDQAFRMERGMPRMDKTNRDSRPFDDQTLWAIDGSYRMDIIEGASLFDFKIDKASFSNEFGMTMADGKITKTMGIDKLSAGMSRLLSDANINRDLSTKVNKMAKQAWYIHLLSKVDRHGKAGFVVLFWEKLQKVAKNSRIVEAQLRAELSDIGNEVNPELPIRVYEGLVHKLTDFGVKSGRDVQWLIQRMTELDTLDSLFTELIGWADTDKNLNVAVERLVAMERTNDHEMLVNRVQLGLDQEMLNHEALPLPTILADVPDKLLHETVLPHMSIAEREDLFGLIQQLVLTHNEGKEQRPGYIPQPMLLSQDRSQWDDIWNRYSPGIDLIDVPNSDFDYSKLASQVYDPLTGVPLNPLSPTNVADVVVPIPLHHPLPQNYDLGTGEVYVDNYIMIDSILAINTLMERSKLRYAGMPAEDAMRELFSKLFAWIQQISPGNAEYDRMFRFSRWYAETCVINLSKHILHRTYDSWRSEMHLGNDLGLPYTAAGWQYIDGAYILQTNSSNATLSFELETYIDGNAIFRGYLDNPRGAGVLEVYIDGDLKTSITANGPFQATVECLQGKHIIDFIFDGTSGQASLSSMEVEGAKFVSAYTSSDDKNTNGLKAMTTLIKMLLSYYDLHHGDGKIKGSKELKQRKLFNWQ